jgi:Zn-dependent peptidase ImmA (M78 family)
MKKTRIGLRSMKGVNVKTFIRDNGIRVFRSSSMDDKEDGCLCGNCIFVRKGLGKNYERFIILHEIGHYILHKGDRLAYSYSLLGHRSKLEVDANAFACLYILRDIDLYTVDIIYLLKKKGVPEDVAYKFFEKVSAEKKLYIVVKK